MIFHPEITFDGVTVIAGAAAFVFRAGRGKEQFKEHAKRLDQHDQVINKLVETQSQIAQNLAVTTALLNERTTK